MRAYWMGIHVAMALVALRVINILLLKQYLDRPLVVLGWIAAGALLFLWARRDARRTTHDARSRAQNWYAALDGPDLALFGLLLVLIFLFHWGFARAASDGREYFMQVRSLIIDRDLDFTNETTMFRGRGTTDIYAFGTPLLWAPFFLFAHLWLGVLNLTGAEYVRDGFFNPYQRAVGIGTLVYGFIALALIYRILCQYYSKRLAAASTLAVTGGSFVVWYLVADSSLAHGTSMFAVTLFLYTWHQTRGADSVRRWALLGATAGLMSLVRWQNILFVVFPAADAIGGLWRSLATSSRAADNEAMPDNDLRVGPFIPHLVRYGAFAGAFIVVFSPQMVFWKIVRGGFFAMPAGAHGTAWLSPELADVLFSPDRGLFSWTPLLLVASIGLLFFARRQPYFGGLLIAALALQVYINGTVGWGGHGFGARRFTNCALIFAIGLAALLQWLRNRPALASALLLTAFVVVNGFAMLGMHAGTLPPRGAIRSQEMLAAMTSRIGNPFALPMNAWIALRYDADLGLYERLGQQTFNNLHIDVGEPGDERFLVRGFSAPEQGNQFSFRWSVGDEAYLVAPLREAVDYGLELHVAPFRPRNVETDPQFIDVWINDTMVESLPLRPGIRVYRVAVPATAIRRGFNEVRFRYGWVASPQSLGLSADRRQLAVRFDRISLIREG